MTSRIEQLEAATRARRAALPPLPPIGPDNVLRRLNEIRANEAARNAKLDLADFVSGKGFRSQL
jgi:hypothetical protein